MRRFIVSLVMAFLLLSPESPTYAGPHDWLVQKVSGSVTFAAGSVTSTLTKGILLSRGTVVQTGDNGKALLVRDRESIFIGPNSLATIAPRTMNGMRTTIMLQTGSGVFNVQKRSRRHFSVETPHLAAVVKGTSFTVRATRSAASVAVQEGLVEVTALESGQITDVAAGQTATVKAEGGGALTLTGKGAGKGKGALNNTDKNKDSKSGKSNSNGNGNGNGSGNGNGKDKGKKN